MNAVPDFVLYLGPGVGLALIGAAIAYWRRHERDESDPPLPPAPPTPPEPPR
jgi:hypothetical protein